MNYTHSPHYAMLEARSADVVATAKNLEDILAALKEIGPQATWLGSRKLGPDSHEYRWVAEAAGILAGHGFAAKTGGGPGIMEAPHLGCCEAGFGARAVSMCADFMEDSREKLSIHSKQGSVFNLPDLNSRHDALFLGSMFHVVVWGRLGTFHELYDLLNRLKHGLLPKAPVYLIERDGYWTTKKAFLTLSVNTFLGARISPSDYDMAKIIDLRQTTPAEFAQLVLADLA